MKISPSTAFHLFLGITSRNFSAVLKKELSNANMIKVEIYYTFYKLPFCQLYVFDMKILCFLPNLNIYFIS